MYIKPLALSPCLRPHPCVDCIVPNTSQPPYATPPHITTTHAARHTMLTHHSNTQHASNCMRAQQYNTNTYPHSPQIHRPRPTPHYTQTTIHTHTPATQNAASTGTGIWLTGTDTDRHYRHEVLYTEITQTIHGHPRALGRRFSKKRLAFI